MKLQKPSREGTRMVSTLSNHGYTRTVTTTLLFLRRGCFKLLVSEPVCRWSILIRYKIQCAGRPLQASSMQVKSTCPLWRWS